jgi:GTP-binding protein
LPEIAFAGRSNVGKSSLINELARTPSLARTSATPGRTQQINFFELPGTVVFADLPGYGFARVPERVRAAWKPLVEGYLASRETLRAVVLIIDPRRGIEADDRRLLAFLDACGRPTIVVASKVDKLGRADRERAIAEISSVVPEVVTFSARSGEGQRELWRRLVALATLR